MSRRRRLRAMRRRRIMGALLFAMIPVFWAIGLWVFAAGLPQPRNQEVLARLPQPQADAIIVFTGGNDRLDTGFQLLKNNYAKKLFISGVHRGVEVASLMKNFNQSGRVPCCVTIGYNARDTHGNAQESRAWVEDNEIARVILVTSTYHMPRSLYYLTHATKDLETIPFPVLSLYGENNRWGSLPGTRALIISEYNKYLVTVFRTFFFGFDRELLSPKAFTNLP